MEAETGCIRSEGDVFLSGADACLSTDPAGVFRAEEFYSSWTMGPPGEALMEAVSAAAGWQKVQRPADVPSYWQS